MKKINVCILFGGISPEHAVSLRSAQSVLNNIDQNQYTVFPVGITRDSGICSGARITPSCLLRAGRIIPTTGLWPSLQCGDRAC